ncbi:MAG: hypothetical protein JNL28_13150 [Planctomycetes bacterium]|nr:hypothetical protein [Planctomycetota bacterium]
MSEWRFRRRQGTCSACEKTFEDGDRHVSALVIAGEELRREDHCVACFKTRENVTDLFFWYTRHSVQKRGLQLDLATLEALFLQLEGRTEERVRELRYVLSLLLMRKRRLRLDRVTRGPEGEAMIVHRPRRKETLKVFVFDFQPERLEVLKGDLMGLLEGAEPTSEADTSGSDESPSADESLALASTTHENA